MSRYAFLILPSHNRVYADAAPALARAEFAVLSAALPDGAIADGSVKETVIGGVPYVTFESEGLSPRDVAVLSNLSSLYALFRVSGPVDTHGSPGVRDTRGAHDRAGTDDAANGDLLRPVPLRGLDRFDDDLLTILKYPGKTNEQFTKLLLNVTLASSAFASAVLPLAGEALPGAELREGTARRLAVLDPLCGRGTTLNQALMYGFDAYGTEIDARDVEAYAVFIQRWLKDKRLKHRAEFVPVRRDRKVVARRLRAEFAATGQEYKAGDVQRLDVVETDAARLLDFFRPESADLVVTDLPYGVQHGSRTPGRAPAGQASGRGTRGRPTGRGDRDLPAVSTLARSPLDLLNAAAPAWAKALRPGGALGISWNIRVARREDAAGALAATGLEVLDDGPYRDFRHRVDQAITRDILIARKPAAR